MNGDWPSIPIIIVSYRTPDDVSTCLTSIETLQAEPAISVHICENGGAAAWDDLCESLLRPDGPCRRAEDISCFNEHAFNRVAYLRLRQSGRMVLVGDARKNLGYAGGINAWLLPLMPLPGWHACWILNPDTLVVSDTLAELAIQAVNRNLGMVGSRTMAAPMDTRVKDMGLHWRRLMAKPLLLGRNSLACVEPAPEAIEALLNAPCGSSCYLTRPCAEALFPLDERYFLYYEELDWGVRARKSGYRVGYAHHSVVIHIGGTSLGSSSSSSLGSPLAIYLEFRNSLLFVRAHFPRWWMWTALMGCLHALRLLPGGGFGPAIRGLVAGLRGESGRPDWLIARHHVPGYSSSAGETSVIRAYPHRTAPAFLRQGISIKQISVSGIFHTLMKHELGAIAIEYAQIASLIALAAIVTLGSKIGSNVSNVLTNVANSMT
jgi:N-acetylglucosaminyl-diphospho-decaprenol L-rhamnosyltransferase